MTPETGSPTGPHQKPRGTGARTSSDVRALTSHQPWASLIGVGAKTIETRSWPTKYRGPLLIHAGKRPVPAGLDCGFDLSATAALFEHGCYLDSLPLGAIVASCQLVDCVPMVADYDTVAHAYNGPAALEITSNRTLLLYPEWDSALDEDEITNVTDQLPFGDFSPGRWAWLLDDVKPTTERCPRCWDYGWIEYDNDDHDRCPQCETPFGPPGCEPVPMRGKQGLWKPTW